MYFSVSYEPTALYFLNCLDRYVSQNINGENINCYVYIMYESLDKWIGTLSNAIEMQSYTIHFFANSKIG